MTCDSPRFDFTQPADHGTPKPRYFRPLVRINAMTNDLPYGAHLDPCWLPMDAIAEATNQTISLAGNVITLSGEGGTVTLPTDFDQQTLSLEDAVLSISNGNSVTLPVLSAGTEPAIVSDATIPTDVVGEDVYLLGKPAAYLQVTVGGVVYNLPAYV